jgi:hypothetical protein
MKQKIQIALILGMLVAGIRLAIIFYERHEEAVQQTKRQEAPALNPDYYVTPKKLYPYDLKSARQLMKQPVWVRWDMPTSTIPMIRQLAARTSLMKPGS